MILAAIDLGSNAIRLLISEVEGEGQNAIFRKLNLVRVPLRLGMDVFNGGMISTEKIEMLKNTLLGYQYLMQAYGVADYTTAASSAMRDAINGEKVRKKLLKEVGIDLKIITGQEEADILFSNQMLEQNDSIFVDVGGGSTEVTIKKGNKIINRKSFNIGTLRILNHHDVLNEWLELEKFLKKYKDLDYRLVGTGGNINKTFSLLKVKEQQPIDKSKLEKFYRELAKLTVTQRMHKYSLREDRADVLVPALSIYLFIMDSINLKEIHVPKIGLADGLINKKLVF